MNRQLVSLAAGWVLMLGACVAAWYFIVWFVAAIVGLAVT
jgi:hypothetical protein